MEQDEAVQAANLIERIGRLVSREAHKSDLQPVQWEALRYLDRANRFSRTAAALTAFLGSTKGTVSQTLNALETKGLIRKQVDSKDRRRYRLTLTEEGRRCLSKDPLARTVDCLRDLPDVTRRSLTQGLEQLLIARLEAQNRKPFGQCRNCLHFADEHQQGQPYYCQLLKEPLTDSDSGLICHEQRPAPQAKMNP